MNQLNLCFPLTLARSPKPAPIELVSQCRDELDALKLTIQLSGMGQTDVGELLGMTRGHMSKCMNGKGNFPTNRIINLMYLCGNTAYQQFINLRLNPDLLQETKDREELAEFRARVG